MATTIEIGRLTEAFTVRYLVGQGLELITQNYRCAAWELDIVCVDRTNPAHPVLVFVEVKYRRSRSYGGGAAAINPRKQQRIRASAGVFLKCHNQFKTWPCRFDAVLLQGALSKPEVSWIQQAF